MKLKRFAASITLIVMLISFLTPFAYAAEDEFRYSITPVFSTDYWEIKINSAKADVLSTSNPSLVLRENDRVSMKLSLDEESTYSENMSRFIYFSSTEDGSITTTYTLRNALVLPDGTYAALSPISETLTFDDLYLSKDRQSLNYSFSFLGEYNAVPVSFDEIRAAKSSIDDTANNLWNKVDTSNPYRLIIRAKGNTDTPAPLARSFESQSVVWDYVLTNKDGVLSTYEINLGSGWQPLDIASWKDENNNRQAMFNGRNFIYDGYHFSFNTAYGETPSYELANPVTAGIVFASATIAAVGAAAASSAASTTANTLSVSADCSNTSLTKPSILINGGGAYPSLANTQKATVELLLNMDTSFGEIYKWTAFATAPDCLKSVTAAAIPPFGESSTAVIMISGEKLPKNKVSVFLEIAATGFDGEKYTASAELSLYEKGLFASLNNKERPGSPDSYTVTRVTDANLDGLAENKILDPTEYIVELYDGKSVIRIGDESITVEL